MNSKNLVIIPTFNEVENILIIIDKVLNLPIKFDILVVDDNSPDGTARVVSHHIKKNSKRINLEIKNEKKGLGKAYIHGFMWGLSRDYENFFEMDADLSHDPKDLIEMCKCLENSECEVVIGSRYINGINVVNWPLNRIILSYCASIYARIVTGIPVKDSTSGFVGFKREALESIDLKSILFNGYAFQIELKFKAFKNNYKIKEIPIIFKDRIYGDSKMSGSIIFEAVFGLVRLKFLSFFKK